MPAIFILDTPEFEPIVRTVEHAGMTVRRAGDYLEATSTGAEVTLERAVTGVRPSIWFAALTGGLVGHIVHFDHDLLRLSDAEQSGHGDRGMRWDGGGSSLLRRQG
ncbi:hypothetical protein AB0E59_27010 [Lentzea sp. NPDC034063]|uniref:hypothetical protein n=1 Tax=unclassified Lentzea TaxID=2643253 RepID=UPI0033D28056